MNRIYEASRALFTLAPKDLEFTRVLNNLDIDHQAMIVQEAPHCIRFIHEPSVKVQWAAMMTDRLVFNEIKNPAPEIQQFYDLLDMSKFDCNTLKNSSERVQNALLTENQNMFEQFIKCNFIPSESVQLTAVNTRGENIRFLLNVGIVPSKPVRLAAIKTFPHAISYLMESGIIPDEEEQVLAVGLQPELILSIFHHNIVPSERAQIVAVQNDKLAYKWINENITPSEQVTQAYLLNSRPSRIIPNFIRN